MVRFEVLLNDGCSLSLSESGPDSFTFSMKIKESDHQPLVVAEGVDYFLGAVVKMFRDMSDQSFSPLSVKFSRIAPANPQLWENYFQCPISFGESDNSLELSAAQLNDHLPTG